MQGKGRKALEARLNDKVFISLNLEPDASINDLMTAKRSDGEAE